MGNELERDADVSGGGFPNLSFLSRELSWLFPSWLHLLAV